MVNLIHVQRTWARHVFVPVRQGLANSVIGPWLIPAFLFLLLSIEGRWLIRLPVPQIGLGIVCLCVSCTQ